MCLLLRTTIDICEQIHNDAIEWNLADIQKLNGSFHLLKSAFSVNASKLCNLSFIVHVIISFKQSYCYISICKECIW